MTRSDGAGSGGREEDGGRSPFTIPNLLGAFRLLGSPWLIPLGSRGKETAFLALFLALTFTDWIDGKLAEWLNQRSAIGPRLDTLADAVMYAALLLGLAWLEGPVLVREWPWIAAAVVGYLASCGASLSRFGRLPSYHTRAAKSSWFLALVAVAALLLADRVWPFRIAAAAVTLTNLEAALLSLYLDEPREDVTSLLRVMREQEAAGRAAGSPGAADGENAGEGPDRGR